VPNEHTIYQGDAPDELLPQNARSNGHTNALFVKSGAGVLYSFTAYSSNAAAQFILVFDSSNAPTAGQTADCVFKVGATSFIQPNWIRGRTFRQGCWIVNSTTEPTLTAGVADTSFDANYV
jgi:hypothetical protein